MSVLENMMTRIRVESETKTNVEITGLEAMVLDSKIFEFKQLVSDQRRLIDFLRVNEKAKERAAVVAWLRAEAYLTLYDWSPDDLADAIERGEHVKEKP
jgi:hypothetical protein